MKKYSLIYCDPPWHFNDRLRHGGRGASQHYRTMPLDQLCLLPVEKLALPNCLLAMWWVGAMPTEALTLVKAWGFRLATMKGFTWHKLSRTGKDHFGMGRYTRGNTEDCLFAVRGSPRIVDRGVSQIVHAHAGQHSEKPDEVRLRLERLMGPVNRVELFARRQAPGWDAHGDEITGGIQL